MGWIEIGAGLFLGFLVAWFMAKFRYSAEKGMPLSVLEEKYVLKDMHVLLQKSMVQKDERLLQLSSQLAISEERVRQMEKEMLERKGELEKLQEHFRVEFKNLSNEILEEKSERFTSLNQKNMERLLNPLKEKITAFEKKVDDTYKEEMRDKISLKQELAQIVKLNQQVSDDAMKLTKALKGDKKLQGDWGEVQLEMILEKAGLQENVHYKKQVNLKNSTGVNQRPDYVIYLPDKKHLILDAKVSLVAYEKYFNVDDEVAQAGFLTTHISNIKNHIQELGHKNYHQLYHINSPDYVILFVPIEPALTAALKADPLLFDRALEKNVVLVSTSTLLATLRTISHIWKQENQKHNVLEIARQSGALYDKFVGFMSDLKNVGKKIGEAKHAFDDSMNKLYESKQKGATIMGRMETLKSLGADASKSLPEEDLKRLDS